MKITIQHARPEDLDTVLGILDDAARWLQAQKISEVWRPGTFNRGEFQARVKNGEVYLVTVDGRSAGTVTVQESDEPFWGKMPMDAVYIHKFAIARSFAGQGIGLKVLEWAERLATSSDKKFLRLDCQATNRKIREYYQKVGFAHVRDVDRLGWKASLYEKDVKARRKTT